MRRGNKIVLAAVLLAVVLALCAQPAEQKPGEGQKTAIKIGVMIDLSGPLTTYGNSIKNTLEIAKEDIDAYLQEKGLPYTVEFYVEDTKVDPKIALEKVQSLHSKGINLIIGPMGSGEVSNIMGYVQSNKIIIISPSST
ncbi:ABC transporter substrate-binding protein, partial [Archaeoglobus fulgidus]|uniref:ABC transporter substrate-binding protein n=1 Tax=Archaeoglobus fulgidus TaxID=2234 RepID=UPI0011785F82